MNSLGRELRDHSEEIVDEWYKAWTRSPHPHSELSEVTLRDTLAVQLRVIGEQLDGGADAESPADMWRIVERLHPEERVAEGIAIEEMVLAYKLVLETVRSWIQRKQIDVPFSEFTYFYQALFELVAESVRRYATFQADQVTNERAQYLAGVAHQMRTPIAAIDLAVKLLEREDGTLDPTARAALRQSATRLRLLVEGVMRLERFAPGEIPVRPRRVVVAEVIDEIVGEFAHDASTKQLSIEVEVDPDLAARFDPALFHDALGNLVHNSIKYTAAGFVRIEAVAENEEIVFRVRDSGSGMDSERQRQLFRPVQPGEGGGAGIGLVVAKRAVLAQAGRIGVESTLGKGSIFWFCLPRNVPAVRDDAAEQDEKENRR